MILTHSQKELDAAASDTLQRIRRDEQGAPRRIKPLLAYIHRHLFDPSLDVNQLKRGCGVRDNSLPIQFHAALGKPPHAYIEDCRLKVACELLANSELKVWKIAQLLGYSSIQVFSRAFTRWGGVRPTTFRKQKELAPRPTESEAGPADRTERQAGDLMQRALKGQLESFQARELIDQLAQLYPTGQQSARQPAARAAASPREIPPPQLIPAKSWETGALEQLRVEAVVSAMAGRSFSEQQDIIRRVKSQTPALFDQLLALSQEAGRDDRQESVPIVRLALDSLDGLQMPAESQVLSSLRARGWTHLANAYRLISDLGQANSAIQKAEHLLPAKAVDEQLQAYLLLIKTSVLRDDDRLPEALEVASQGVDAYRNLGEEHLVGQMMIAKAMIHRIAGDFGLAIVDLRRAAEMVDSCDDDYLKLSAYFNLTFCYVQQGQLDEASKSLSRTQLLTEDLQQGDAELRLLWLRSLMAHQRGKLEEAEEGLLDVHRRLNDLDLVFDAAVAGLDLAALYVSMGKVDKTLEVATATLPIFDTLKIRREAIAALGLLKNALERKQVEAEVLSQVKAAMARHISPPPAR